MAIKTDYFNEVAVALRTLQPVFIAPPLVAALVAYDSLWYRICGSCNRRHISSWFNIM